MVKIRMSSRASHEQRHKAKVNPFFFVFLPLKVKNVDAITRERERWEKGAAPNVSSKKD